MEPTTTIESGAAIADDRIAFALLAAVLARLDEAGICSRAIADIYRPGSLRREAVSITGLEGSLVRMETLATLLADSEETAVDRGSLMALGIHNALEKMTGWPEEGPTSDEVSDAFKTSDAANGRLMRADAVWSLEDDSEWMANELSRVSETSEPWTAVEVMRSIWTSGRFFGNSRRMALIAAPWVLETGFGLSTRAIGIASGISKNVDAVRNASGDKNTWSVVFAERAAAGIQTELENFRNVPARITSMEALCPTERSSSRIGLAIRQFMRTPVVTTKSFSKALNVSDRGAKIILDKLIETSVIDVEGGARNRKFVCRRAM
ncbi:hypothetical protein [Roseibium sp. RKSG952]|uniref:hypothetical protein n=1 Tax=Roseibium sp. RKSG952 TaxID=2529384 RepID=UPI0012BCBEA3|nr:hypothetical protein [Roseibium sp. RKSG952]MTH95904.1 hypothetical protein [Roseibium sp. RKSG952]